MRKGIDQKLTNPALCTVKISRALIAGLENYKLHTVAKHFNIPTPNRHRAIGDCEITIKIWAQLLAKLKEQGKKTIQDINSMIEQAVVSAASHGEVPF
jgi:DNA polymerase III alpha subunit (gram-positive type)